MGNSAQLAYSIPSWFLPLFSHCQTFVRTYGEHTSHFRTKYSTGGVWTRWNGLRGGMCQVSHMHTANNLFMYVRSYAWRTSFYFVSRGWYSLWLSDGSTITMYWFSMARRFTRPVICFKLCHIPRLRVFQRSGSVSWALATPTSQFSGRARHLAAPGLTGEFRKHICTHYHGGKVLVTTEPTK